MALLPCLSSFRLVSSVRIFWRWRFLRWSARHKIAYIDDAPIMLAQIAGVAVELPHGGCWRTKNLFED